MYELSILDDYERKIMMKYDYRVYKMKVENHEFWVAESKELIACVAQGETKEEAIAELDLNEIEWLKTAKEFDIETPLL